MRRRRAPRGFTLLELMVVVVLMGTLLLVVPTNIGIFGARSRLNETANSMAAAFSGARQQAILDAYQVALQIGSYRDEDGETRIGWRYEFTSVPAQRLGTDLEDTELAEENRRQRREEREWLYTEWHEVPDGIALVGVSEERGVWQQVTDSSRPYVVRFFADGGVEKGVAVRFESDDLDVAREYRTLTVVLNALTSEPSVIEGEHELPEQRPSSDFGN